MKRILSAAALLVALGAWFDGGENRCAWEQWGQSADHEGSSCAEAQPPAHVLAEWTFDNFVDQEKAETFGVLFTHYQAPLNDDEDNVFMMQKTGNFIPCDPPGSFEPFPCGVQDWTTQVWSEKGYHWNHGRLEEKWTFATDWKPFAGVFLWEPMFQPALSGPFIYVPGAGGSVWQVLKVLGVPIRRINPFDTVDPNTYVSGGITVDKFGNLYWNVLQFDPDTFVTHGSIVRSSPFGRPKAVSYDNLIPDAPTADTACYGTYYGLSPRPPMPWPPPPQADGSPTLPPTFPCAHQRPGTNVTPAVSDDGTIFTATKDDNDEYYSYVVALTPDLRLKWATSLRGLVSDGCGFTAPYGDESFDCSIYGALGVDPNTGLPPALLVDDDASSSPVALPDGGVAMGTVELYNEQRGHLVKLDSHGRFRAAYNFGWDSTPAVYRHDHTYSLILKDNHYGLDFGEEGPFYITQLDANLVPEWKFQNTTTEVCERQADGTISCVDDGEHAGGFEWCINAPAVDRDGNVMALSEDGNLYVIGQNGRLKSKTFMTLSLGAAYTPVSIDARGRIYGENNGSVRVLGR